MTVALSLALYSSIIADLLPKQRSIIIPSFFGNSGLLSLSLSPLFTLGLFKSEVLPSGFCEAQPQGSERPAQSSAGSLEQQPDVAVRDAAGEGEEDVEWRNHGHGPLGAHPSALQELQGEERRSLCGCYQRGQVRMTYG